MSDLIKPHYQDEDILMLNLCTDVNKWKSEVTFIEIENQFYSQLFASKLIEKTNINKQDIFYLRDELEGLEEKNQEFLVKLREFINDLDGLKECDDVHCDTYYLNNHQNFKVEIENYFFKNRNLKTLIYSYLKSGIKEYL